jgi:aspartyl/asparaginyl beta-hydroxylase (cupin superfamily)
LERLKFDLEDHIRAQLENKGLYGSAMPPRFHRALDIMVGGKQAYQQAPRYFFYPELAPIQFFERSDFPFLDEVEAGWTDIRAELAAIDASPVEFEPYLKTDPRRPKIRNVAIADKLDWGAYFMVRDGVETPEARATPKTLAALSRAPLARIAGRSPSVLFSRLLPGAHIPVHTGMINARLICHLAVVAPRNCWLRVGNERREWQEGKAWVFDDTIEHEAFNGSDRVRTILLFDIWRPELDEAERAGIVAICEAIDGFSERREWD